jgi:diguanylate cyclase (GGDEF)-like protein
MKTIALISRDSSRIKSVTDILDGIYNIVTLDSINRLFEFCFNSTPDLIVLNDDVIDTGTAEITSTIKSDPLFGHLPVIAIINDIVTLNRTYLKSIIDDYIRAPFDEKDITFRIDLCISRAEKILETNPLTRLPGNITIIKEIQRRIDSDDFFALAYADIDYFKPFNDAYGFSRGDEVIRMTGRLISNIIKMYGKDSFIGHVGGDDFIFIFSGDVERICKELITNFDGIVPTFYDTADREKGFIESIDREGNKKSFPLLSLSIGIAHNTNRKFSHYGKVSEIATELKSYAKRFKGSCYKIDNRLS